MTDPDTGRRAHVAHVVAVLVAALPVLPGILSGGTFYFRDLAGEYFPFRRLAAEGLRAGRVVEWNPYVHEGVALTLPAVGYPLDLLHALWPDERLFSLVLALHVPLAAAAFLVLARSFNLSPVAAAGGALVYALGGFTLSALNLYRYVQALAWAPLVVWSLARAGGRDQKSIGIAAGIIGIALSTTGIEIVLLSALAGLVLAEPSRPAAIWARRGAALALGVLLASAVLWPLRTFVSDSARGAGFPTEVVLAHSVHPLTWVQVVIGGFYGDLGNLPGRFWGSNFFPRGFPYFLSLYLGATVLAVAVVGARFGAARRTRLLVLLALGVALCLGQWSGLAGVVDLWSALRIFRYPVKAFFLVQLAVALFVAWGLEALLRSQGREWRWLAAIALAMGAALGSAPWWPRLGPSAARWFLLGFFPADHPPALRVEQLEMILRDAAIGGGVVLAVAACAGLAAAGRLPARTAVALVAALLAGDLIRTGAGLNRTVSPAFLRLSADMTAEVARMRSEGGRVFTCDVAASRAYAAARPQLGDRHELWTFAALLETLSPQYNLRHRVASAYSPDLTMLVPEARVLKPGESCEGFDALEHRLRDAGIAHVLSVDPLDSHALTLLATLRPVRIAPLAIHVYRLRDPAPLRELAGSAGSVAGLAEEEDRLELEVKAQRPSTLVVRDAFGPGWSAWADGDPLPLQATNGGHRAIAVPAGTTRVVLAYRPAAARAGAIASLIAAAAIAFLCIGRGRLLLAAAGLRARASAAIRRQEPTGSLASAERRLVLAGSVALAIVTTAPYVWSLWYPPAGTEFKGTFYSRDDFYQYVSFAEQAGRGAFLFRNKFDVAPHVPALVNLEWWMAGVLGRAVGGPVAGFHCLKLIALVALVAGAVRVLTLGGLTGSHRVWALVLFLSAGGAGWLRLWTGTPGWEIPDIAMGFYPFHQSLTNAHFVVGSALLIWSLILLLEWREGHRGPFAWTITAVVLGLCRPYDLVTFTLVALLLCALDFARRETRVAGVRRALALLWLVPVFAYYALLIGTHASFRTWGGQGLDVSPPRYQYVFALLPVALVLAVAVARHRARETPAPLRRALLAWALGLAALLAVLESALTKQSVITMGAAVLLLAGLHIPRRWLPWTALAAAPTSVFLVWRVFNPWPECFAPPEYFRATRVLAAACSPFDVALAPTDLSLMIAGLTPCSVALGHRTLTPHYARNLEDGERFYYDAATPAAWRLQYLDRVSARFVLLPAGRGGMLGVDPPYGPILRTGLLEVWERGNPAVP